MTLPCCVCPPRPVWTPTFSWALCLPLASFFPTITSATSLDGDAPPVSGLHDPSVPISWFRRLGWVFSVNLNASFPLPPFLAGGSLSAQLKQAYLPVVDHANCTRSDWWGSTVKTNMVCGGGGAEAGCNVSRLRNWKCYKVLLWRTFYATEVVEWIRYVLLIYILYPPQNPYVHNTEDALSYFLSGRLWRPSELPR